MLKQFLMSKQGLIITTLVFLLFIIGVLPYVASISETRTHTAFSPDTGFLYTPATFYDSMAVYGESGRQFYIVMRWTFDVLWPLVYTGFFISIIGYLSIELSNQVSITAITIVLLAVLFDLFENILATINVGMYPERSLFLLRLLQGASLLKWLFIVLTMIEIGILNFHLLIKKIRS